MAYQRRGTGLRIDLFLGISTWWKDQIKEGRWEMELSIELGRVQVRVGKGVKGRANPRDLRQACEQTAVAKITAVEMRIWKFFF